MAFIRRRLSQSYSYQIIETYRAAGKVKQRVLCNVGPSPTIERALDVQLAALEYWERERTRHADDRNLAWVPIDERHIAWTKRNIKFLETVVVSMRHRWQLDTARQAFYEKQLHLYRRYERLGVVSSVACVCPDTTPATATVP